jgi:hypothetical protein
LKVPALRLRLVLRDLVVLLLLLNGGVQFAVKILQFQLNLILPLFLTKGDILKMPYCLKYLTRNTQNY